MPHVRTRLKKRVYWVKQRYKTQGVIRPPIISLFPIIQGALLSCGEGAKVPPPAAQASKEDETDTSAQATGRVHQPQ
jgi:hypothetical protein